MTGRRTEVGAIGDFTAPVWPVRLIMLIMLIGLSATLVTFLLLAWADWQRARAMQEPKA